MCEDCGRHGDEGHRHDHEHEHDHDHSRHDESTVVETDGTVRVAVTGKGGVGKTTLAAAIARELVADTDVTAVDADPDMNLASTLDVPEPDPVTDQQDLIEDRAGTGGGLIRLTPEVTDVLESKSTPFGETGRLLTIGAPTAANTGCMCPENSFVRSLVSSALDEDYVVMDMEAGVEHLGRGTVESVDALVIVVEPSQSSIDTASRIGELADDLGIEEVRAVVNKTRGNADVVRESIDVPVVATLPYDEDVAAAGLAGESPVESSSRLREAAADVVAAFQSPDRDVLPQV